VLTKEAHPFNIYHIPLMTEYRRFYIPGATWFFTVNTADRGGNELLVQKIDLLREAFRYVRKRWPFHINAVVIMPDHLHCLWTLPKGDSDFSMRWNLIKGRFSRSLERGESITESRRKRRERGVWQRRFWAHLIVDQEDFNQHVDYIHWNPIKHGKVRRVVDWPYSSFHKFVERGTYSTAWGHSGEFTLQGGEREE